MANGSPDNKPATTPRPPSSPLAPRAGRDNQRPHFDPHQAGWYNLGIASLMIVLVVLLIRGIWFSSF